MSDAQVAPGEGGDLRVFGVGEELAEEKRANQSSRAEDCRRLHTKTFQFCESNLRLMTGVSYRQYRLAIRHLCSVYLLGGNHQ
jgi:hypothetical protein